MAEATMNTFNLDNKSPPELEARRRAIVEEMRTKYPKGYNDPDVPMELLQELAVVISFLRRKNAGPPKAAKAPKATGAKTKSTVNDLLF